MTAPRWAMVASSALSVAALAIASYLTAAHFSGSSTLACPDTGIVNCALVTTSSWSAIAGVPLALLGLVWAVAMTGLTLPWAWRSAKASIALIVCGRLPPEPSWSCTSSTRSCSGSGRSACGAPPCT